MANEAEVQTRVKNILLVTLTLPWIGWLVWKFWGNRRPSLPVAAPSYWPAAVFEAVTASFLFGFLCSAIVCIFVECAGGEELAANITCWVLWGVGFTLLTVLRGLGYQAGFISDPEREEALVSDGIAPVAATLFRGLKIGVVE